MNTCPYFPNCDSQDLELTVIGGASVKLSGGVYIFVNTATTSEEPVSEGVFNLDNVPAGNYII